MNHMEINKTKIAFRITILLSLFYLISTDLYASDNSFKTFKKKGKLAIFSDKHKQLTDYIFDKVYESPYIKPNGHSYANSRTKFPYYGLILVRKKGQFSYLNEKCQVVLPYGTFDFITPLSYYGYSMVRKGYKWGVINNNCELIAPLVYDIISQKPLVSYENAFKSFLVKINNKYRILDDKASWTLKVEFDTVQILFDNFYLGKQGNKLYLINDNCIVISDKYSLVESIDEGFIVKKDSMMGIVNKNNKALIPFIYDSIHAPHRSYYFAFKNNKCGVINLKGDTLIPFEYELITRAWEDSRQNEERFIVQRNKKFGTISFQNKEIIPIIYDGISGWVEYGPPAHYVVKDNKCGLVTYDGKLLIPLDYDYLNYINNSLIECIKEKKHGVIDINNRTIVPCINDSIEVDYNSFTIGNKGGRIKILKNGIWSYLDLNGKPITVKNRRN